MYVRNHNDDDFDGNWESLERKKNMRPLGPTMWRCLKKFRIWLKFLHNYKLFYVNVLAVWMLVEYTWMWWIMVKKLLEDTKFVNGWNSTKSTIMKSLDENGS